MPKIKVVLEIELNEETMKENNVTPTEVFEDLQVVSDDTVDGYLVTRYGDTGDITGCFYLDGVTIVEQTLIGDK